MSVITNEQTRAAPASNRQILGAVLASCVGWSLDLFDLFILLFVAPILGHLFFPSTHAMLSLAAVYASFGVTLLMRPLGAALFGSYADQNGRKRAMITAMVGVGISTALFGALPTVQQVGLLAPIVFIALRLVQGVFVGGVVASTHTIGTESVAPAWRGAVSGLIGGGGAGLGALFASLVYLVMSSLFQGPAFAVWGWRCMFFTGIISAILGIFIFSKLEESPFFKRMQATKAQARAKRSPLKALFSRDYRSILFVNLLLTIGGGAGYYLTSGMMPTFLKVVTHTPPSAKGVILTLASISVIFAAVASGHLSNLIGRKKTFLIIGVLRLFLLPMLVLKLPGVQDTTLLGVYVVIYCMIGTFGYAPILIFLNERFPTAIRATGTGLSWNIGFAIGGILPTFVSLASPTPAALPHTLAVFLVGVSVLYLIGALVVPETRGRLDEPAAAGAALEV